MSIVASADIDVTHILEDLSASEWLKAALRTAMARDPVDALNDALALAGVLEDRLRAVLELDRRTTSRE
jgi:hypothetical protein